MTDYKKIFAESDFDDMDLEVSQDITACKVEIGGNKKGLLYFICRLVEFYENLDNTSEFEELNLDAGIDFVSGSSNLCVYCVHQNKQD